MRAVKVAVVVMGILILFGTVGLVVAIVMRKQPSPAISAALSVVLDEPADSRIVGIASVQDRLAVAVQSSGADHVLLLDPRTGAVAGRIALRH